MKNIIRNQCHTSISIKRVSVSCECQFAWCNAGERDSCRFLLIKTIYPYDQPGDTSILATGSACQQQAAEGPEKSRARSAPVL